MNIFASFTLKHLGWALSLAVMFSGVAVAIQKSAPARADNKHIVTIYADGEQRVLSTDAGTVAEVLKRAEIPLSQHDAVEPAKDTKLAAQTYNINVYRARPVIVVDGQQRSQVMSPYQSAPEIAKDAGLQVFDEDILTLERIEDFVAESGAGLKLTIVRSAPVNLMLYGTPVAARTQAKTVGEFLKEKNITLAPKDGVSPGADTPLTPGMAVAVYRNGSQTVTEEQEVPFEVEYIQDRDRPAGFREVREPGTKGRKVVTFQIELRDGREVSRKEIQSVVTVQPKKQVEVVGAKAGSGLSKSKGVYHSVDSQGVQHRETYYDLPMSGVIRFCGGTYSVRDDGAKVDQDGYVLVAANLSRYPRCSVVETSLGLGKVYDTGGFASVHPDGFDLATDWSNYDGK